MKAISEPQPLPWQQGRALAANPDVAEAELRLVDALLGARRVFLRDPPSGLGSLRDAVAGYERFLREWRSTGH